MTKRFIQLSWLALCGVALTAAPALAALEAPEKVEVPSVTATTAQVRGVLNPRASGKVEGGFWAFQFGVSEPGACVAERTLPEPFPGPGPNGIAAGLPGEVVEETLTGLQPHAKYTVCLLELNALETELPESVPVPFETERATPTVESDFLMFVSDSGAKPVEAQLAAIVNANNEQITSCEFEYGTEPLLKTGTTKVPCEQAPSSFPPIYGGQLASVSLSGLQAKAKYYYRLVASNATGVSGVSPETVIESFTTPLKPEVPETKPASPVGSTTATLHGVLNPNAEGDPGTYEFLYKQTVSTSECEGGEVSGGTALGSKAEAVEAEVTGLEPSAHYTFCLLARNEAGETTLGPPETLTTSAAPPGVEGETASSVKASEATLEAQVNPNNQPTTYTFEYATSEAEVLAGHGAPLPGGAGGGPISGFGNQTASAATGGVLSPGTVYYFRASAENKAHEKTTDPTIEHFKTAIVSVAPEGLKAEPIGTNTATLNGVLNPTAAGDPGTYEFFYRQSETECQGAGEKTAAGTITGARGQAATAALTGLLPGTHYTFCLLARNTAGETAQSTTPVTFTTLAEAPTPTGESVENVQYTAATLNAQVDPGGATTTYHFEYIDQTGYNAALAEAATNPYAKGQSSPATKLEGPLTATATVTGLTPGSTYHYRVVASNVVSGKTETAEGADETFTTPAEPSTAVETCPNAKLRSEQPYGPTLPDCRAYEMVSPLNKNDNNVEAIDARASVSGDALTYLSPGSFSDAKGEPFRSRYIGRRESDGWSTQNITPPYLILVNNTPAPYRELLFTPELSKGILLDQFYPLIAGEEAGFYNVFVGNFSSTPIAYEKASTVSAEPRVSGSESGVPSPVGVSTDLSHVVFQAHRDLTANATGSRFHAYEWVDGRLSQVDVPPPGTEFESDDLVGAPGGSYEVFKGDTQHAVSASGLRVFFTAGEARRGQGAGQLYVRENPEQSPVGGSECAVAGDACTVEVSASQRTTCNVQRKAIEPPSYVCNEEELEPDPNGPQPAFFRDASTEGERVFFTSRAELTNNANTGPDDNAANLYEYNLETGVLTDLTVVDTSGENPDGAAVLGLATAGEEGSYVYFVANGVLTKTANAEGAKATPGDCKKEQEEQELSGEHTCNLYVARYVEDTWETKFIATLTGADKGLADEDDEQDWKGFEFFGESGPGDDFGPGQHTVRVTPDGTMLAFESERSLTGYDNEPATPGDCTKFSEGKLSVSNPSVPCREVYLYNATTAKLICASCNPSGARPVGRSELSTLGFGIVPPSSSYESRNLSEDGRRLFFQSRDALVPHDSNGKLNVYEWEAAGEGSCTQTGGCIYPISDVAGDSSSEFMDASPNGENVFIATADQLVPSDTDTRVDVYDVRVGGGFPVTAPPPECDNADSCKPPASSQPGVFGPTGSATFTGNGNFPTPPGGRALNPPVVKPKTKTVRCKKGDVKNKKGKCAKKPKKKKKAKKSSHGKGRA
jgi:hypothetical protein